MCDAEYHIFCLSPPLDSIPTDNWFCPMCWDVIRECKKEKERRREGRRESRGTTGGKRGRPKGSGKKKVKPPPKEKPKEKKKPNEKEEEKVVVVVTAEKHTEKQPTGGKTLPLSEQPRTPTGRFATKGGSNRPSPSPTPAPPPTKRGPGRPPKKSTPSKKPKTTKERDGTEGRGTKTEVDLKQVAERLVAASTPTKRTRVADPEEETVAAAPTTKGSKSFSDRPPASPDSKVVADLFAQKPMFSSSGMLPSFINQRSRSGRVVKRNTVYDEMTEGIHRRMSVAVEKVKEKGVVEVGEGDMVGGKKEKVKEEATKPVPSKVVAKPVVKPVTKSVVKPVTKPVVKPANKPSLVRML